MQEKEEPVQEIPVEEVQPAEQEVETDEAATDTAVEPEIQVEGTAPEEDPVDALEAQLKEKNDRILRLQADFENFRRRTAKEKEELTAVITQNILGDLLPLLDNFERAMAVEQTDGEAFQKGVEMIFTQLREVWNISRQRGSLLTRTYIRPLCAWKTPTSRTERSRRCCRRATARRGASYVP